MFLLCQYTALWYKRIYPYQLATSSKIKAKSPHFNGKIHPDLRRLDIRRGNRTKGSAANGPKETSLRLLGGARRASPWPHNNHQANASHTQQHKQRTTKHSPCINARVNARGAKRNALRACRDEQLTGRVGRRDDGRRGVTCISSTHASQGDR